MRRASGLVIRASLVVGLVASAGAVGLISPPSSDAQVVDCDDLPNRIEASTLIELQVPEGCYWVGKMITDQGVGARVQPPGRGVYTQSHGARRAKELSVETLPGGGLQLAYVGDVVGDEAPPIPPIPGLPIDPDAPLDPVTGLPLDPVTGLPLDPVTGLPLDPVLDPDLDPVLDPNLDPVLDPNLDPDLDPILDPDLNLDLDPDLGLGLRLRMSLREPCSSCPPPCSDDSNHVVGYKEFASYRWKVNRRSIPNRLNKTRAVRMIKRGFNSVKNVFNDCNISENLGMKGGFDGRTTARANISKEGRCLSPDGRNVIDFGPLPAGGLTCSWFKTRDGYNEHIESDVRLSKPQKWTMKPGPNCSGQLDLRSLVTHEIGHVFGLGHVGDSNKNLTMTERVPVCSRGPRTLGLGDIRGLRALY